MVRATASASAVAFVTACASNAPRAQPAEADAAALAFAQALAADPARAHGMLSASLRSTLTHAQLATAYREMTAYGSGAPTTVAVQTTLDAWPDQAPGDLRWVYVAIANDTYSEGVSVVVTQEPSRLAIRSFQLGRP
jgi:hypothetical protein